MPRVSVIVPSYNHETFAIQCVESVLSQTFKDWEMIVVDDGSSDDSVAVFRGFGDPRIHVQVNESNLGTYGTQNRAIELSNGEFVSILNSDDWWEPSKLEQQVAAFERHPDAVVCYTLGWRTDVDGALDKEFDNHHDWPTSERHELVPYLIEHNNVLASGVMFRRNWAEFDSTLRYSGDWIALLRACFVAPPICLPDRLTYWRQHHQNASQIPAGVTSEEIRVRRAICRNFAHFVGDDRFNQALVRQKLGMCAMHLCALYLLWGNRQLAIGAAWQAAKFLPNKVWAFRRLAACILPREQMLKRMFPKTVIRPKWAEWSQRELDLGLADLGKLIRENTRGKC